MLISLAARATVVSTNPSLPSPAPSSPNHKNQPRSEQVPQSHSTLSAYTMPPLRFLGIVSPTLRRLKGCSEPPPKRSEKGELHCH